MRDNQLQRDVSAKWPSTVEIATKSCITFSDALVLLATWRATGSIRTLAQRLDVEVSLASLLLADGMLKNLRPTPCTLSQSVPGTIYFA